MNSSQKEQEAKRNKRHKGKLMELFENQWIISKTRGVVHAPKGAPGDKSKFGLSS